MENYEKDNLQQRRQNNQNTNSTNNNLNSTSLQEDEFQNIQNIDNSQLEDITSHETENDSFQNQTINMDECLKLFNIKISNGPIYVCTICLQTWFRRSVSNIDLIKVCSEAEQEKLNQCRRHYVSAEDKEWICKGC